MNTNNLANSDDVRRVPATPSMKTLLPDKKYFTPPRNCMTVIAGKSVP